MSIYVPIRTVSEEEAERRRQRQRNYKSSSNERAMNREALRRMQVERRLAPRRPARIPAQVLPPVRLPLPGLIASEMLGAQVVRLR